MAHQTRLQNVGENEALGKGESVRPSRRQLFAVAAAAGAGGALMKASPAEAGVRRSRRIQTRDGVYLFHRETGEGPPIVFIAGWALPSDMWSYQTVYLAAQGFRCISYDRRGHGRSDDPGRGFDYDTLADDLAAVLEGLDLTDVTLVGHSMAAGEMVRYFSRYGGARVARMLFLAPACTPYIGGSIDQSVVEALRQTHFLGDFPNWLRENARPFVMPDTSDAMIDWLIGLMTQTSMPALIECNRAVTSTDFRAELPNINVRCLVVHGGADVSAPLDLTGRATAAAIPGAQMQVYDDAPHGLFITHANQICTSIASFAGGG